MTTLPGWPSPSDDSPAVELDTVSLRHHRAAGEFAVANFGPERPIRGLTTPDEDAAAWLTTGWSPPHHTWLYVVGTPTSAVDLGLRMAHQAHDLVGATVERTLLESLPSMLRPSGDPWDWWSSHLAPRHVSGEEHVVFTTATDTDTADEIKALLDVASPDHWAPPGHPTIVGWALLRDADSGSLVACAGQTLQGDAVPHLASVATHPEHRGRGHARTVVAALTRHLFEGGAETVTLGMHANNDPARRVYSDLGFTVKHEWLSGRLPQNTHEDDCAAT